MQAYIDEFHEKKHKPFWLISKMYEINCTEEEIMNVTRALRYKDGWAHFQSNNIKAYKQIESKARKEKLSLDNIEKLLNSVGISPYFASKIYLGNY